MTDFYCDRGIHLAPIVQAAKDRYNIEPVVVMEGARIVQDQIEHGKSFKKRVIISRILAEARGIQRDACKAGFLSVTEILEGMVQRLNVLENTKPKRFGRFMTKKRHIWTSERKT